MKRTVTINEACKGCKEPEVKHYAKGMCQNCYMKERYHAQKQGVDKQGLQDVS